MNSGNNTWFVSNSSNGNLQVAWLSLDKQITNETGSIMIIKVRSLNQHAPAFSIGNQSSFSDFNGISIANASLVMPALTTAKTGNTVSYCSPNPFGNTMNINVFAPESGKMNIKITNLLGQEILSVMNGNVEAGNSTFTLDAAALKSGMYLLVTAYDNGVSSTKTVERIVKQ